MEKYLVSVLDTIIFCFQACKETFDKNQKYMPSNSLKNFYGTPSESKCAEECLRYTSLDCGLYVFQNSGKYSLYPKITGNIFKQFKALWK